MQRQGLAVIILAAGKGTRMKSSLAKVLQPLNNRPLLSYVLDTVYALNPDRVIVVVGYQADKVKEAFPDPRIEFVDQREQLGTGHAVQQAASALQGYEGTILVLCGDMPFVKMKTLQNLLDEHSQDSPPCTMWTLKCAENKDFGRVIRDENQAVARIVENRDVTEQEKKVDEYNTGVYCFDKIMLFNGLKKLDNNNAQREYYLTDIIQYFTQDRLQVRSIQTRDADELLGINTEEDLKKAERILLKK